MNNRLEDNLQIACVSYFRLKYPDYLITSFPAGFTFTGNKIQRIITGKIMKDMGYCNGFPDLFIPVPNRKYSGLFLELKIKPNKPTNEQTYIMLKLTDLGYCCSVCYCIDDFMKVVKEYMFFINND